VNISDLGEFGFLERVRSWVARGDAEVGIGDDGAVARLGDGASIVAAADALVEGVHFRWDWSSPADIGFKAVVVNLSDLAAMGAEPRWLLLSLAVPADTDAERLRGIYEGIGQACEEYRTELVGGDTVRSDQVVLAVTALGELDGEPLRRSGAKVGDVLAVTGPLGKAAAGMNLLLSQDASRAPVDDALACIESHRRPVARIAAGRALRVAGAHAGIDLSDGLASDVRRLAEASCVGIEIDRVPVAPQALRVAESHGWDAVQMALVGGEDFELLVALPDAMRHDVDVELIPIGRIVDDGIWLVADGKREALPVAGNDHFR
jgi:thiamine-monophosphate kinase